VRMWWRAGDESRLRICRRAWDGQYVVLVVI
jgi:hypothetical protein